MAARPIATEHQEARSYRMGEWKIVWGKRQKGPLRWELYHLKSDRSEQYDLSTRKPEIVSELAAAWKAWARQVGVHIGKH